MPLSYLGLLLGFIGAVCQAWNYAVTKEVQQKYKLSGLKLLGATHVLMCLTCLIPFLFLGYYRYLDPYSLLYTFCIVLPYLCGQYFVNKAIGLSDSSIVAPLLAIKIPILAFISVLFLDKGFNLQQTVAIVLIISIGWYFSSLSGKIGLNSLICVLLGCVNYCLSDLSMAVLLMPYLKSIGVNFWLDQVFMGSVMEYVACGIPAFPMLFLRSTHCFKVTLKDAWCTRLIVFTWLANTFGLVSCFNLTGVVEGNIIQSLRGVIGVLIAYLFYRKYIQDPSTFRKKLYIALAMFLAVGIYHL